MSTIRVRGAVSDGRGGTAVRELGLPDDVSRLKIESSAVCGTDVTLHAGGLEKPAILGHHVIGRVDHLTESDAESLGVAVGTRVAVEEYVGCGECAECRAGRYRLCPSVDLWTGGERVGMIPATRASGLHGGNAEYLELTSRHVLHALPEHLSVEMAAWTLPLANAVDWTLEAGQVGPGKNVVVIGPGYHGISCVAAALAGGAESVTVLGRRSSAARLDMAARMGAHTELSDDGVVGRVLDRSGPVDAVIDTIGSPQTSAAAVQLLSRFGVLVLAGLAGGGPTLDSTAIVRNMLTVRGVRGRSPESVARAIALLDAGSTRLDGVPTFAVPLEEVGDALHAMGSGTGPATPHVVIDPWQLLAVDENDRSSLEATR
ncbi:threonine dehydrogenase-like Zn-dependent dehydrogenase [Nocardioides albertanoniae]|uniref:Threonine dehydrogenase-like Zn-dependent dehydrogenase n=1 Tax=Nocardioides albertanoniae TaxID=1175486 RepID=A0A543A307_9ACTN|nr:zinc-binding dehydrogenase [Nocardioides albertanoniae]TQL66960.1 threonine dehydrogenase-like Zn-dependent dehydrogenase [Nocardioides albertanoniae]